MVGVTKPKALLAEFQDGMWYAYDQKQMDAFLAEREQRLMVLATRVSALTAKQSILYDTTPSCEWVKELQAETSRIVNEMEKEAKRV